MLNTPKKQQTLKQTSSCLTELQESWNDKLNISKSGETLIAYNCDVRLWIEWLENQRIKKPGKLKPDHVTAWIAHNKRLGKRDSTLRRYHNSIKSFCRFLVKAKAISADFLTDFETPKAGAKYVPFVPTEEQIKQLLKVPNVATETGCRDRAIMELLYSSGLRASELCDLEICDIVDNTVIVKNGKGSKSRMVPMTQNATFWINHYIEKHRGKDEGYLFVTLVHKKRINRKLLSVIIGEHAKKINIKGVTTHTLRHACATHILNAGGDIRLVQEILGHASIATTQVYTQLSTLKIAEMFKKFHPGQSHGIAIHG